MDNLTFHLTTKKDYHLAKIKTNANATSRMANDKSGNKNLFEIN